MTTSQRAWEHFHHEADIGVRGVGATCAEAFEEAARALTAVVTDPESVRNTETITVTCEAPDDEALLVDWLNALVYEMAVRKMVFGGFRVTLNDHRLTAEVDGERIDNARHDLAVEIKGATYTSLDVHQENGQRWIAQCVVDV